MSSRATFLASSLALVLPLVLAACDGDDNPAGEQPDAAPAGPDAAPECSEAEAPCLAPPANGFQLRSVGTTIQPGEDVEFCEVVLLPGTSADTYYVNRFENAMTDGSHHLIVSAAVVGSTTEANMTEGERVPCVTGDVF